MARWVRPLSLSRRLRDSTCYSSAAWPDEFFRSFLCWYPSGCCGLLPERAVVGINTADVAVINFIVPSATGSGIAVQAIVSGFVMGFGPLEMRRQYWRTFYKVRFSLITVAAMISIGFMMRYSGLDA